jgi:hypothetical protein
MLITIHENHVINLLFIDVSKKENGIAYLKH